MIHCESDKYLDRMSTLYAIREMLLDLHKTSKEQSARISYIESNHLEPLVNIVDTLLIELSEVSYAETRR